MRPSRTVLGLVVSTFAVAALGCGGDADTTEATLLLDTATTIDTATTEPPATTEPRATDPPATEPTATDTATTEPPATDPPATEPASDDGTCLVGDWVVTEAEMDAFYGGLMSTLEAPLTMDTVGSAALSFAADGTYGWAPDFALTVEIAGQSGTGNVSGTITGNWVAADGVVTTSSEVNALAVSVEVNGVTFDGADLANGLLNSSPVNGVTYSCDGATPVIDFKTADPGLTVPVSLTPA